MNQATEDEPGGSPSFRAQLFAVIKAFQAAYREWEQAPTEDEKSRRREVLTEAYALLWPMLMEIVEPMARKWVRGHRIDQQLTDTWEQSVLSLSANFCLSIIDGLPGKEVNADGNIVAFFRKIAYNKMVDEHRRDQRRKGKQTSDAAETSAGGQLPKRRVFTTRALDEDILRTVPDEFSADTFDHVDNADFRRKLIDAILAYWRGVLSGHEWIIMELRLGEPQVPYAVIASRLGPTWTEASVRQRFSRIRRQTLQHLRAIGVLSD